MRTILFIFILFFSISIGVTAQPPCSSIPGMNPQTAIAVCGTTTFNQTSVASCSGPQVSGFGACNDFNSSDNAFWYKFHCYQSGTIGFVITPQVLSDDYDWELFNVTGVSDLNSVYTDERLMVSLNLCGSPNGITGCTSAGVDSINCGGPTNLINRLATIYAGNDYLLMVNNWSNSGFGYSLKFAGGTAVITDNQPPDFYSFSGVSCNATNFRLVFSEDIKCSSVTPTGSEFSFNPPGPPIASITSGCASTIGTITELIITLQSPLPPGSYDLVVNAGTDGNTFLDVCDDEMAAGSSIPFFMIATPPPVIQSFSYNECDRNKLTVNFDKPIDCASLTANGSEFTFSPPGPIITGISSNCGVANFTSSVTLSLQNPVPTQIFNVVILNGTDGNTLSDTCASFMPQGANKSFVATEPPKPLVDSVQYDKCSASFFKVFYSRPILCNTISPDGSQYRSFFAPLPAGMPVSATPDPAGCSQGYTTSILVQMSAPITMAGIYRFFHVPGSDGRNLMDTCNVYVPQIFSNIPNSTVVLNVIKPTAIFNSQVKWGCTMDTILLSHPGGNAVNSWIWNFSDGSSATGQNVSHLFPVTSPSADVQLIVSNGICSDTSNQNIILGNSFKAGFSNSPVDSFCVNTPVTFTDTSRGNIVNYLWDFGDLTQFNGQNPPPHSYPVSNNYPIRLIVTDIYGCKDTATQRRFVTPAAFIDFTGLKPQYCTDNKVLLTRKISRFMSSYVWDNGDGKTFTNEVDVVFSYPNEGVYTITLSGTDRYCGTASAAKTVPVFKVPLVSLGRDTVLCQSETMLIGVPPVASYTYLWSTGATTSQIYSNIFTRDYTLTADNHGCKGIDNIHIKVLPVCLIKVPNAFTPNHDGLNDELKALNADLAKDFSFKIFNRLGQLVFSTTDPLKGWNGKFKGNPASTGTYVWVLSYISPFTGDRVQEKGTSILLR